GGRLHAVGFPAGRPDPGRHRHAGGPGRRLTTDASRRADRIMSRKNIENIYSLSPMQQGLLFHSLVASHEASYPVQIDWTLRGNLDEPAFLRAWQEVVDRHPILRTAFAWERLEKPMQIV